MRKLLVIILLLGTFINHSEAKIQAGIGVNVGPNFGRMNNQFLKGKLSTAGGTLSFVPGVHAAIQGRIWINKFVGVNLGVEFNMGGSSYTKYSGAGNVISSNKTHKENQLTIPVTIMAGWGNQRLRVFANAGGYFGYNISGTDIRTINNNGSIQPKVSEKADYKEVYNNIDAGVRMGAGIQVYVSKDLRSSVTFDMNYDFGLVKTFRSTVDPFYNNSTKLKLYNSKFNIGVGYMYTFGKNQAEEQPKAGL